MVRRRSSPERATARLSSAPNLGSDRERAGPRRQLGERRVRDVEDRAAVETRARLPRDHELRSEEHTSELQSQSNLVCRLLLEKKKKRPAVSSAVGVVRMPPHAAATCPSLRRGTGNLPPRDRLHTSPPTLLSAARRPALAAPLY